MYTYSQPWGGEEVSVNVQHFQIDCSTPCIIFGFASDTSDLPQKDARRDVQEWLVFFLKTLLYLFPFQHLIFLSFLYFISYSSSVS